MALKALIFAGNYKIYLDFIDEFHLKRTECKYVHEVQDIQGYHKDTNPDLLFIFLEGFWLTPIGNSNDLPRLTGEFPGQVYHSGIAEAAARLIQLTYMTKLEQLPEYLTHEIEAVRVAALKKQEEYLSWKRKN